MTSEHSKRTVSESKDRTPRKLTAAEWDSVFEDCISDIHATEFFSGVARSDNPHIVKMLGRLDTLIFSCCELSNTPAFGVDLLAQQSLAKRREWVDENLLGLGEPKPDHCSPPAANAPQPPAIQLTPNQASVLRFLANRPNERFTIESIAGGGDDLPSERTIKSAIKELINHGLVSRGSGNKYAGITEIGIEFAANLK